MIGKRAHEQIAAVLQEHAKPTEGAVVHDPGAGDDPASGVAHREVVIVLPVVLQLRDEHACGRLGAARVDVVLGRECQKVGRRRRSRLVWGRDQHQTPAWSKVGEIVRTGHRGATASMTTRLADDCGEAASMTC